MRAVAVGGGHGTAVSLRALRQLTSEVTGIVSVADNGGSSGRLREDLEMAAVGDIRKCLAALADSHGPLTAHLEHRFRAGDLEGHAFGNLLLAGLIDATGDLEGSVRAIGTVLNITGEVLPAATAGVVLVARTDEGRTEGQVEVAASTNIRSLSTEPATIGVPERAVSALAHADLVVIGPGSLYTSVLAACVVPGMTAALASTPALRVFVANLHEQTPETQGYSVADHVSALARHGVPVDVVVLDRSCGLVRGDISHRVVEADIAGRNGRVHDAEKMARCFAELVA